MESSPRRTLENISRLSLGTLRRVDGYKSLAVKPKEQSRAILNRNSWCLQDAVAKRWAVWSCSLEIELRHVEFVYRIVKGFAI